MIIVSNGIRDVSDLRLEARLFTLQEAHTNIAKLAGIRLRAVFEDSLACLEHQVETRKLSVLGLELIDNTQGLQIVFEATEVPHAGVQLILTGMAEWCVPKIVRQAYCLGERLVEIQGHCGAASDLGHLQRVRQTGAIQVTFVVNEHLRLVNKAAKRR